MKILRIWLRGKENISKALLDIAASLAEGCYGGCYFGVNWNVEEVSE